MKKSSLFAASVHAGFPSPADDYIENKLDLNEYLVPHPASTFFVRVEGNSMQQDSILSGDILIVDRSIEAYHNSIIVAFLNGEFTVKRMHKLNDSIYLVPANRSFRTIRITEEMDFRIWGVVTSVIHRIVHY